MKKQPIQKPFFCEHVAKSYAVDSESKRWFFVNTLYRQVTVNGETDRLYETTVIEVNPISRAQISDVVCREHSAVDPMDLHRDVCFDFGDRIVEPERKDWALSGEQEHGAAVHECNTDATHDAA